ncbi:MAG TPA: hypothetical protein VKH81_06495 [Candidatus Angelobacter sp.]|nr:hypothetical protein [Candidatus Angelobacter sp.]
MRSAVWAFALCALLVGASPLFSQNTRKTNSASTSTISAGTNLRSIAGAPFSAEVVRQSTQLLPDGSRTMVETRGKMFRDAAGRTRVESEIVSGAGSATRHFITIVDPGQQLSIVLDVEARTGAIFHLPAAPVLSQKQLKLVAAAQAHRTAANRSIAASEDLGTMTIEGFSVTGTRSTHPAEAGAAGGKAGVAITESWFSPDLKVQLLGITQLPQAVTQTTRLTNIVSGAPEPALFQVPAGYTVKDHSVQK